MKRFHAVIAALIVVLVIASGAVAAQKYVISSSSQVKPGAIGLYNLSKNARKALKGQVGTLGAQGAAGAQGAKGDTGSTGAKGATGATGLTGATGPQGAVGPQGAPGAPGVSGAAGAAWLPSYGVAKVLVDRGSGANAWATYSTTLGSPVGDTAGGAFRFTCNTAPCHVSVAAYVTAGTAKVYPRVLIHTQSLSGGSETYCEYGDGTDNNGGTATVGTTTTAMTLGIGGSLDCGAGQTYPTNGIATTIDVPAGYYDVFSTFVFAKQ